MLEFLAENWLLLLPTIGGAIAWISERKKRISEGRIGLNDATKGMQEMYDRFVEDASKQYDKLNMKIQSLEDNAIITNNDRERLLLQIKDIERQVETDKKRMLELETKISQYEETIRNYELKIREYEKEVSKLNAQLKNK